MDKSWITKPQNSTEYDEEVRRFIDFSFQHSSIEGKILCHCSTCGLIKWLSKEDVYDHLCKKFPEGYTFWFYHGEAKVGSTSNVAGGAVSLGERDKNIDVDPMFNMINEAFGINSQHDNEVQFRSEENIAEEGGENCFANEEVNGDKEFFELARDGEQPLYERCRKYSKFSFIVKLYHIKCLCGMTDKSMTMILELLHDALEHANIPSSFYEAKKTITKLGLDYKKILACPNNCMLYWGVDNENRESCKVCNASRWKPLVKEGVRTCFQQGRKKRNVPAKVVRYFPLKPRLQRSFLSTKTAKDMRWHAMHDNNDGLMRHPRDSEAWKKFDELHTSFASDPRNV